MSNFKPGDFKITSRAMELWKLPKGSTVLDIGCGQGEAVEYLQENYGFKASGIDVSTEMIEKGLARNPKLDIKFGDGEFLDDYPSYSFNGVMMECVLSLINLPDEALHEVYCVLKKGGKLFISDLYIKNPKPEFLQALAREAEIQQQTPHSEGDCSSHNHSDCDEQDCNTCDAGNMSSCDDNCSDCSDCSLDCDHSHDHDHSHDDHDMGPDSDYYKKEHKKKAVPFRSEGRLAIDPLIEELKEIGFQNIQWEDFSIELDNFVAEKMMSGESLEECFFCESLKPEDGYKTGYFLLVAEKPL